MINPQNGGKTEIYLSRASRLPETESKLTDVKQYGVRPDAKQSHDQNTAFSQYSSIF